MKKMKKAAKRAKNFAKKVVKKAAKKVVKKAVNKGESSSSAKATADRKVEKVMSEYKHGKLHSGSKEGPRVKNPKQAIAIALSEARKSGAKIPKPTSPRLRSPGKK